MASRRNTLFSSAAALALAGGYGLYLATAQSVPPELAQAPMNVSSVITPAFIMAVDDSGSMTFETLFPGGDGQAFWDDSTVPNGFFASGALRTTGDSINPPNDASGNNMTYNQVMPYPGHRIANTRAAIPATDTFGFAKSPEFNPAYFNPSTTYSPWKNYDGSSYPDASTTATKTDPRVATDPTFDMTVDHRDRTDDAEDTALYNDDVDLGNGDFLLAGWQIRNQSNSSQTCSTTSGNLVFPASGAAYTTLGADRVISAACTTVRVRRTRPQVPTAEEMFIVPDNAVLASGTWYYAASSCAGLGDTAFRRGNWTRLTSNLTVTEDCEVGLQYFPATFYLKTATAAPAGFRTAVVALGATGGRSLITNACGNGCSMYRYEIKPANYSTTADYNAAIQNFANWFSYYGDRNRAMIAGMTTSLVDVNNMRIGYFTINQHASRDEPLTNAAERTTMFDMADNSVGGDRNQLYTNMIALPAANSTPNRQAVYAVGQQFLRTDADAPVKLACQKNAGMLFTDGFSNQDGPTVSNANGDGNMGAPFSDGNANTMADIAAYYYNTNLRTDLTAGQVIVSGACPVSGNAADLSIDCNRDPHMNFYGITLGARGNLFNPDITQNAYTDSTIYNNWPSRQNDNPSTVDDIWHGTVNSRGEYVNAKTPSAITAAMRRIIEGVNEDTSPSGTIAVTGSRVGTGSLTVQPRYFTANSGTDWYGQLTAETVTANAITGETTFTTAWEASATLATQAVGSRIIKFGTTSNNVVPTVRDFTAGNVSLASLCTGTLSLCTATEIQALAGGSMNNTRAVAYLRGDRTDEGALRTRTSILGDIINSPPLLSAPTDDYGYKALGGTLGASYATFLTDKKTADRPMVYVGANDGMLHMFDGRTASPGGSEVFAYVPATALGHMGNLLFPYDATDLNDQKFQHRYFVDGPITVSDVNIGGVWKTVMVGTAGAGGRGVFALDVTNPGAVTVLWEVNNLITGNTGISNNIGHVLGKPVVVPFKDSSGTVSWKAIFGNGYNSTNQQARLFVVDIGTGAVTTIVAAEATAPAYNGLGNVVVVDRKRSDGTSGRDGYSDTAYAADQNGAVWKFDLLTSSLAISTPLYIARDSGGSGNRQSILGGLTAATGPSGGVMVYFGTGSFSFNGDPDNTSQQTLYGILDKGVAVSHGQLLAQTVGSDDGVFRVTSNNAMTPGRQGWYLNLPSGERVVGYPRIESGIVFFPSYEPSAAASTDCSVSGVNWLYGLNALSGGAALSYARMGSPNGPAAASTTGAVALVTGGSAPVKDVAAMTTPRIGPLAAGATQAEIDAAAGAQCSMVIRVAGAPPLYLPRPCGRQSWRQVR